MNYDMWLMLVDFITLIVVVGIVATIAVVTKE